MFQLFHAREVHRLQHCMSLFGLSSQVQGATPKPVAGRLSAAVARQPCTAPHVDRAAVFPDPALLTQQCFTKYLPESRYASSFFDASLPPGVRVFLGQRAARKGSLPPASQGGSQFGWGIVCYLLCCGEGFMATWEFDCVAFPVLVSCAGCVAAIENEGASMRGN